jgi:hypothetical protein
MNEYSIIFKERCNNVGCEHGTIRFSDRMGYENCDCDYGYIFTEIKVTKEIYDKMKDELEVLPF